MRWHIFHYHKQIGKICGDACAWSKQQVWHLGLRLPGWKWHFRAPTMVWCWLIFGFLFNNIGEGSLLHYKHSFLYSWPQIFTISPLLGVRSLKNRLQSSTCIRKMVTYVWNMRAFFLTDHVSNKTHVFIWPYPPPSLQNLLLNLMI